MRQLAVSWGTACLLAVLAVLQQTPAAQPRTAGRTIFVVALRDSHVLTLCPHASDIKATGRPYRQSYSTIIKVEDGPNGMQVITRMGDHPLHAVLPAPAAVPAEPAGDSTTLGVQLDRDRLSPDPTLKAWIERELAREKRLTVVDSAETADIVFIAEAFWRPSIVQVADVQTAAGDSGVQISVSGTGDFKANRLQGVIGVAVPGAVYRDHPGDANAWLAGRVWEGSDLYAAAPRRLVDAFRKDAKADRDLPVCAASNHPFSLEGVDAKGFARQQEEGHLAGDRAGGATGATFRTSVTYVAVPVRATDASGRLVAGLAASDFGVREDGVDQTIDRLLPMDEPFDVAVLADTSVSMRPQIEDVQAAVLRFIQTLRPDDRVMPVSFDDRITAHAGFLSDRARLRRAMFRFREGEGTRLWDALDLVRRDRLDPIAASRKAIVLFTDGVDTRSRLADAGSTIDRLAQSHVPVYVVQFDTRGEQSLKALSGRNVRVAAPPGAFDAKSYVEASTNLQALADVTGGRLFRAETIAAATQAFDQVARELNGLYTLCYYPTNQARDGRQRRVVVSVSRPEVAVSARATYRAASDK